MLNPYLLKTVLSAGLLVSSVFTCLLFSAASLAEENVPIEKTPVEKTQTETPDTNNETANKNGSVSEISATATPQPPLIEPQTSSTYEPPTSETTTDNETTPITSEQAVLDNKPIAPESADDDARTIGGTPQPPLIDPQHTPSYGPQDISDKDVENKNTVDNISRTKETTKSTQEEPGITAAQPAPKIDNDKNKPLNSTEKIEEIPGDIKTAKDPLVNEALTQDAKIEKELAEKEKIQNKKWTETYPVSINADWLQLKSGEWLRGRITILQKDNLEFDSDELDDLVIEWKNVKYLKSYEPYSLRFDSLGRTPVTGTIEVIGSKVHVRTDYDEHEYDRSDLITIASGKETEISYWKSKITFSINVRQGNTDQTDFTSKMTAKRRTTDSRLVLDYLGNFTKVNNTETINNHRLNETYDVFLSRDLFWTPVFSELFRDPFQNIEQRVNVGLGIGYSIINTNKTDWDITGGPAYQTTKFVSVLPGTNQLDDTLTLALGTNFNTELNTKVDLQGLYNISLGDQESGNYTHHSLLTIETELTDKLDLDITTVWDYVNSPVADENGDIPEQSDFRILIGLGYDL